MNISTKKQLRPMLKWSGSKEKELKRIITYLPNQIENYIEPFVGGGSLFFYLNKQKSIINDTHNDLINAYLQISKKKSIKIYEIISELKNEENVYYDVRKKLNSKKGTKIEQAAWFIFINKTCFRGMLRYNPKGEFNIPFGRYKNVNFDFLLNKEYEKLLSNTVILNEDFNHIFDTYDNKNNFVFLDPPYDFVFKSYNGNVFDQQKHKELADKFKNSNNKILMIIGKNEFIEKLYKKYIIDEYEKTYQFRLYKNRINLDNSKKIHLVISNYK